jgi:hypothetical protein
MTRTAIGVTIIVLASLFFAGCMGGSGGSSSERIYSIAGWVVDRNDVALSGLPVELYNPKTQELLGTTTTDMNGAWSFGSLKGTAWAVVAGTTFLLDGSKPSVILRVDDVPEDYFYVMDIF